MVANRCSIKGGGVAGQQHFLNLQVKMDSRGVVALGSDASVGVKSLGS